MAKSPEFGQGEPEQPEETLLQPWDKHLLPNCEVIAVDERDPKYPNAHTTSLKDQPVYNFPKELLGDEGYIRLKRIELESAIRDFTQEEPKIRECFSVLKRASDYSRNSDSEETPEGKMSSAIVADYRSDPTALLRKLS